MYGDIGNIMQQFHKIQEQMNKIQEEISNIEVTGTSGAGIVKVTINGSYNCRDVYIDPSIFEEDKEVLEDLIAAAFNDAVQCIAKNKKEKINFVSSKLPI